MKFTRLKLHGFKSFSDLTELHLEPGLTGVVGPNGCGKSNLVEALRWVMGESSYKAMRATGMDDVIFNGSGNRPQRNSAEVTLVLDNTDRTAPAAMAGPADSLSAQAWTGVGAGHDAAEAPDLESFAAETVSLRAHLERQAAILIPDPTERMIGAAHPS